MKNQQSIRIGFHLNRGQGFDPKIFIFLIAIIFILLETSVYCEEPAEIKEINSVNDFEYVKNGYFFASPYYRDCFERNRSYDLLNYRHDADMQIMSLQVWVATQASDPKTLNGVAVVDLENYQDADIEKIVAGATDAAVVHKGYFKPLPWDDFGFNGDQGFFWLNEPAANDAVVAISYKLKNNKIIGSVLHGGNDQSTVGLRLIKPGNQDASEKYKATWPLMMKNVYALGKNLDGIKNISVKIVSNQGSETNTKGRSFINAMGLDMIDEGRYYKIGGDGILDYNSFNINLKTGMLIFPSVHPFCPEPDSRFKFADAEKTDIYNSFSESFLKQQSKYKITVVDLPDEPSKTVLKDKNQKPVS